MKKLLIFMVVIIIAALGCTFWIEGKVHQRVAISDPIEISIPANTTLDGAIKLLNNNGLLKPDWFFDAYTKIYARYSNDNINAGFYRFTPNMTNKEVLNSIFVGMNQVTKMITFPEGLNIEEIAQIASDQLGIDKQKFVGLCKDPNILKEFSINAKSCEGFLMPDTYEFFATATEGQVIRKMLKENLKIWTSENLGKARYLGFSKEEIATLASIVEAETNLDADRAKVAGVYWNRLKIGMLLQADPTVQYALGEKRNFSSKDKELQNPYNTYKYPGLPPGPINSPGRASILAALSPEKHKYYYFVAKGDGSKEHFFSTNFEKHKQYVAIYRKNRRANNN